MAAQNPDQPSLKGAGNTDPNPDRGEVIIGIGNLKPNHSQYNVDTKLIQM